MEDFDPSRSTHHTSSPLVSGMERSLSPDLVSLSSTSGSETQSDLEDEKEAPYRPSPSPLDRSAAMGEASMQSPGTEGGYDADISRLSGSVCHRNSDMSASVLGISLPSSQPEVDGDASNSAQEVLAAVQYQLLDKDKLAVSDYESTGLLYARASDSRHNIDLMHPADELAEEVSYEDEDVGNIHVKSTEVRHVKDLEVDYPTLERTERWVAPIDPGALLEMEKSARNIAMEMTHVMDNLRNSLYAMTVCTKQSMQLHREAVDNLHTVVDANVKGMYTFMTKFEELHKSLTPMKQLATQIREMDENLKILERTFTNTK